MIADMTEHKERHKLSDLVVVIKGAGEMASAVAWRIYMARIRRIVMLETPSPLAVRRTVSFCEAVHGGRQTVEGVSANRAGSPDEVQACWQKGHVAVCIDPHWTLLATFRPDVVVDAILAKKNLGTGMHEAPLVIGLGPGFVAGQDVHMVIETNRGHHLGRIITDGRAEPNTGTPGAINGYTEQRVLRAPCDGEFKAECSIGDHIKKGDRIGTVASEMVQAPIEGVLRGLIRSATLVQTGLKIGDIDPRGDARFCHTISDKARAISGSVLEAILRVYN
ncbi:MAG: EF2563 family selenium-dependent molybdenum hydroxylase system protein [Deltaproteobacteria bacterium]|jgi:xanthine dehydrogenase accessory factor|nr:EF2563 family selenium-dependent molybdenum hydroxylase system protein [Deltaproteobacteria bacterium]